MTTVLHEYLAAVLAGHGDRGGDSPNRSLLAHAEALREKDLVAMVCAGVLKGRPSLEEALESAAASGAREIIVYPVFMSAGYFTNTELPSRIRAAGFERQCRILTPLGLDPAIPGVMISDAISAAQEAGLDVASTRLLVAGHGSKFGPGSARATRSAAAQIEASQAFGSVSVAFLEEAPFLDEELRGDRPPTIVSGFFSGEGLHAGEDVPAAIRESRARAVYAGPVGASAGVAHLMAQALHEAAVAGGR